MKKQPQRTCVACRRVLTKRQLCRIVRTPAGQVLVDPGGKLNGRGVYLCTFRDCWAAALKHRALGPALKATLTAEDLARLEAYAQQLPERPAEAPQAAAPDHV